MQKNVQTSLMWPELLTRLRSCAGESVLIRDGKDTAPAAVVRLRPSAKGTELCLFSGETAVTRAGLIQQVEAFAGSAGRRFMKPVRASINNANLLVDGVGDETIDDAVFTVVNTRRPRLGFNQSQQTGHSSHLRTKRIKTG